MVFFIIDVMELIQHNIDVMVAEKKIDEWFSILKGALSDNIVFYLSDAYLYGFEMGVVWDKSVKRAIESSWNDNLQELVSKHSNVRIFSYSTVIQHIGENNAFSNKRPWPVQRLKNHFHGLLCLIGLVFQHRHAHFLKNYW